MNELLNLLTLFQESLELQVKIFGELLPVLDREEHMLMHFDVADFEKVVVEKDQLVRRAQSAEERRLAALKRICFMISYDARGQLPTLRTFIVLFENYVTNTEKLVDPVVHAQLKIWNENLRTLSEAYLALFKSAQPRIFRNQLVLKKMVRNFERSLAVMQNEANVGHNYNSQGKAHSRNTGKDGLSFVRVKA